MEREVIKLTTENELKIFIDPFVNVFCVRWRFLEYQ